MVAELGEDRFRGGDAGHRGRVGSSRVRGRGGIAGDEDPQCCGGEAVIDRNENAAVAQITEQGARSVRRDHDRQGRVFENTSTSDELAGCQAIRVEMGPEADFDAGLCAGGEEGVPDATSESGQGMLLGVSSRTSMGRRNRPAHRARRMANP